MEPEITAQAAILIDYQTGLVLYSKKGDQQLQPASTTKILTALLALELGDSHEIATVSKHAAWTEGTGLGLQQNFRFYLGDLIRGALINSGNDAAATIAEHLGGDERFFAGLMNYKMETMGALHSTFINPHGLSRLGHFTTSYDLALAARYALHNNTFRQIVGTRQSQIYEIGSNRCIYLRNTNRLLGDNSLRVIGVKTGTTAAAGQCLVAAAEENGDTLISVVLNSADRYSDTRKLLDYGYHDCYWLHIGKGSPQAKVAVNKGRSGQVPVGSDQGISIAYNREQLIMLEERVVTPPVVNAPVRRGLPLGKLEIYMGDQEIAEVDLVTTVDIRRH